MNFSDRSNKSDAALAIFVKTPGLSSIKTRLAASIGQDRAEEFYRLAVDAIRAVAMAAHAQFGLTPYWAIAEEHGLDHPMWSGLDQIGQGTGGLGTRLHTVYSELLQRHREVLFVGADSPQLAVSALGAAIESLRCSDSSAESSPFVLGRTTDGGFYLFGGRIPVSKEIWESVSYSVETTAREFASLLRPIGSIHELPVLCDVDTADDLLRLGQLSRSDPELLPKQVHVLEWAAQYANGS